MPRATFAHQFHDEKREPSHSDKSWRGARELGNNKYGQSIEHHSDHDVRCFAAPPCAPAPTPVKYGPARARKARGIPPVVLA